VRPSADKKFTSGDVPLVDLLDQARNGTLLLPDLQRGWVWDDNHIPRLLASVSLSYPIGAVMTRWPTSTRCCPRMLIRTVSGGRS